MSNPIAKASTKIRHQAIYRRYKELEQDAKDGGRYNYLYLTGFYVQIGDEMGYSDNYVGRIVARMRKEELVVCR